MPKPTKKPTAGRKKHGPLSFYPLSLDDALRAVLAVKPEKRAPSKKA